jgi:hypothetical protein
MLVCEETGYSKHLILHLKFNSSNIYHTTFNKGTELSIMNNQLSFMNCKVMELHVILDEEYDGLRYYQSLL